PVAPRRGDDVVAVRGGLSHGPRHRLGRVRLHEREVVARGGGFEEGVGGVGAAGAGVTDDEGAHGSGGEGAARTRRWTGGSAARRFGCPPLTRRWHGARRACGHERPRGSAALLPLLLLAAVQDGRR